MSFPGGSVVKNLLANAGEAGLIPSSGRFPEEGNGNPLQCSCLENPRDGGAWWAAIYGVAQSRTQLKRLSSSSSNCTFTRFPSYLLSFQLDCKIHGANPCLFYALLRISKKKKKKTTKKLVGIQNIYIE